MKATKDIIIEATDVIERAKAIRSVPATTPEMIGHYRRHLQLNHAETDLLITPTFAAHGPMAIEARFVRIHKPVIDPNNA
ncbi:hypothetical protein [Parapedobacter tibetensis]|nr:hypothetical protein [Parapedobacter tibetensis]